MNAIINWFNNLSRSSRYMLIAALCFFTPAVSISLTILFGGISAAFSVIGFVLSLIFNLIGFVFSLLNWKGVLFFIIIGMFFAAKAGYSWVMSEEEDDTTDVEDNPFTW